MGLFTCLLFSVLAAWIIRTVVPSIKTFNKLLIIGTGLACGFAGCIMGKMLGFADIDKFNLYSLGIAVWMVMVMAGVGVLFNTLKKVKLPKVPSLDEHELQFTKH